MKLVAQENEMGCGVTCVAAVLSLSYKKTLELFPKGKAEMQGFTCKEIIDALGGGFRYEYKYIKPRLRNNIYKERTIVFIKRSKKYPEGHYLVRANKKWMDPWINFPDRNRKAGFIKKLPGRPIYAIFQK